MREESKHRRSGVTRIVVFDELLVGRRSGVVEDLNLIMYQTSRHFPIDRGSKRLLPLLRDSTGRSKEHSVVRS